jgi:putative DNA primase/helicase
MNEAIVNVSSAVPSGSDIDPWKRPVKGDAMLDELVKTIKRYLVLGNQEATVAVALWIVFTHVVDVFRILPLLAVLSPTCRCGKTTLLTVLACLVRRPLPTASMTPAVLFRTVDAQSPTLLIDEADTFIKGNRELRGMLNCGHNRATAKVQRTLGKSTCDFNVACPKAIAAIGLLPDTLVDRSIMVKMERKAESDTVEVMTMQADAEMHVFARKIARWAEDNIEALKDARPVLPSGLINRAADNWTPLLAIADRIGGKWPEKARLAAVELSKVRDSGDDAIGEMLLRDLKFTVEKAAGMKVIPSRTLVDALVAMEHRPWPMLLRGRVISASKLAGILKRFDIRPDQFRDGLAVVRGYKPEQFAKAFARYAN